MNSKLSVYLFCDQHHHRTTNWTKYGLRLLCVYVMSMSHHFNGNMYFHIFTQAEAQYSK